MEKLDKQKIQELQKLWSIYMSNFFTRMDIKCIHTNKDIRYNYINIYNSNINISNEYGFLSLRFRNRKQLEDFLKIIGVQRISENNSSTTMKKITTKWPKESFPSRLFISTNNKILSFYFNNNKSIETNIVDMKTTFKNIMNGVIKFKELLQNNRKDFSK